MQALSAGEDGAGPQPLEIRAVHVDARAGQLVADDAEIADDVSLLPERPGTLARLILSADVVVDAANVYRLPPLALLECFGSAALLAWLINNAAYMTNFARQEGTQYWYRTGAGEMSVICSGLAHRHPPVAVTPRTTFHCFSTTKPVTALAVLQLAAAGGIALDEPLTTYLPDIPYRNGATVRQVLSHQGGMPNPLPLSWVHADDDHTRFDAAGFRERVLRRHRACGPAGRRVRYSNIGFLLLGRLIEVVSGGVYHEVIRQRILDVVGCNDARSGAYLGFDVPKVGHATGYTRRWSGLGLLISLLPDPAGLRTNEGGWIRYRPFHLDGASYGAGANPTRGTMLELNYTACP